MSICEKFDSWVQHEHNRIIEMSDTKSLEDKIRELKEQNSDLVNTAQFWRMQYKKCEEEKLNLLKENNELILKKRQNIHKIKNYCELLQEFACKSIKDIYQISSHAVSIGDTISEYEGNFESNGRESTSTNYTPGNSPSNIHHVRPMIGGVTLKTPVLKVSRANLGIINNRTEVRNDVPASNSPVNNLNNLSAANVEMPNVSVCLQRIDSVDQNRASIRRSVRSNASSNPQESLQSGVPLNTEVQGHGHVLTEFSVTLNRIDDVGPTSGESHQVSENEITDVNISDSDNRENPTEDGLSQSSEYNYANEEEMFHDYPPSETMKYSNRLECIIEETTGENTQSSGASAALTNIENGCQIPKQPLLVDNSSNYDDPLEGPSWLSNSSRENSSANRKSSFNFVTERKKDKLPRNESLFDGSSIPKDADQVPDSTTDVNSMDNTGISLPQCQSTPNVGSVDENKNDDSSKENVPTIKTDKRDKINNAKVILSRIRNSRTPQKRKAAEKKNKAKKTCVNLFPPRSSEKPSASSDRESAMSIDESNCTTSDSNIWVPISTNRPKRHTAKKDYKELSCNKKLRR